MTEILFAEQRISHMNENPLVFNEDSHKSNMNKKEGNSRPALEVELHRKLTTIIENGMEDPRCRSVSIVWRLYINSCLYLASTHERESAYLSTAKKAFYRGLRHCAGCKDYLVSSIISLRSVGLLTTAEIDQILEVMNKRGLLLRFVSASY